MPDPNIIAGDGVYVHCDGDYVVSVNIDSHSGLGFTPDSKLTILKHEFVDRNEWNAWKMENGFMVGDTEVPSNIVDLKRNFIALTELVEAQAKVIDKMWRTINFLEDDDVREREEDEAHRIMEQICPEATKPLRGEFISED